MFAAFLETIYVSGVENAGLILKSEFLNTSSTYESYTILNNIFRKYPKIINNQMNPIYNDFSLNSLYQIPGVKFWLSEEKCRLAWNTLSGTINSSCEKYGLTPYEYVKTPKTDDSVKWGVPVTDYLISIMSSMPKEQAAVIIDCLLGELKTFQHSFSWRKKLSIFALVLWYSADLETRSRLHKMVYIARRIGIIHFFILAVLYKPNQQKLTEHIISLRKSTN